MRTAALATAAVLLALGLRTALACECVPHSSGFLVPSGAVLPADARGVPFACGDCSRIDMGTKHVGEIPPNAMRVYVLGHGDPQPIPFHVEPIVEPAELRESPDFLEDRVLVVPDEWKAGERYLFQAWPSENPAVEVRVDQRVAAEATRDSLSPPRLKIDPSSRSEITVWTRGGSCSGSFVTTSVHVRLTLPGSIYFMAGAFLYYTRVDGGRAWHVSPSMCQPTPTGRSWEGLAQDRVYARRPTPTIEELARGPWVDAREPGLDPGDHTVEIIAWLPGTSVQYRAQGTIHLDPP